MRVVISMESCRDVDGSAQPVKRYLSEIKDDGKVSNTGMRCRELDCLRGYYYLSVLHCLQERCNHSTLADLAPGCRQSGDCESGANSSSGENSGGKGVSDGKGGCGVGQVRSTVDQSKVDECHVNQSKSNGCATNQSKSDVCGTDQSKSDVCDTDQSKSDVCGTDQSKSDMCHVDQSEPVFQAKGDCVSHIDNNQSVSNKSVGICDSSSHMATKLTRDENNSLDKGCGERIDSSLLSDGVQSDKHVVSGGGDASASVHTLDQAKSCVDSSHDKTKELCTEKSHSETVPVCCETTNESRITDELKITEDSRITTNCSIADELKNTDESKMTVASNIADESRITLPKLKHLTKGLLWDIQAKKSSLTETLGYIHKAISKHLLADDTKDSQCAASDRSLDLNQKGTAIDPPSTGQSVHSSINNHNVHTETEKAPNQTDDSVLKSHTSNNLMNNSAMPLNTPLTSIRRLSEEAVPFCGRKGSASLSEVEMIALASAEPSPKSRKVLWEDQPPQAGEMVDYYSRANDGGGCVMGGSTVKYINVPDEWYGLPVDEKYFTSYVTMGLLKEEQEYVMHELKRIPDCSQVSSQKTSDVVKGL